MHHVLSFSWPIYLTYTPRFSQILFNCCWLIPNCFRFMARVYRFNPGSYLLSKGRSALSFGHQPTLPGYETFLPKWSYDRVEYLNFINLSATSMQSLVHNPATFTGAVTCDDHNLPRCGSLVLRPLGVILPPRCIPQKGSLGLQNLMKSIYIYITQKNLSYSSCKLISFSYGAQPSVIKNVVLSEHLGATESWIGTAKCSTARWTVQCWGSVGPPSLVGGIPTPLKNMKVSWDDDIPNIWKVIKAMFQTTNQQW